MPHLIVLAAVLAASGPLQNGALEGRVLVAGDGRPAADVVVSLDDHRSQTLDLAFTDAGGRFRFERVPTNNDGAIYVVVDHEGFEPVMERIDFRQLRGLHTIYLSPARNPRPAPSPAGDNPFVVDAGQLTAAISDEARKAYDEGISRTESGETEEAIDRFERAVELAPDFYDAWIKLGIVSMESGRGEEAERAFVAARDVNPTGTLATLNLGILRYTQGDFENALVLLTTTVSLNPGSAPAHFYRGEALYRLGRYGESEAGLLRAVELDPLSRARLTLVNVYVRLNDAARALVQAEAFLDTHSDAPERTAIERVRDQLREALGR